MGSRWRPHRVSWALTPQTGVQNVLMFTSVGKENASKRGLFLTSPNLICLDFKPVSSVVCHRSSRLSGFRQRSVQQQHRLSERRHLQRARQLDAAVSMRASLRQTTALQTRVASLLSSFCRNLSGNIFSTIAQGTFDSLVSLKSL